MFIINTNQCFQVSQFTIVAFKNLKNITIFEKKCVQLISVASIDLNAKFNFFAFLYESYHK